MTNPFGMDGTIAGRARRIGNAEIYCFKGPNAQEAANRRAALLAWFDEHPTLCEEAPRQGGIFNAFDPRTLGITQDQAIELQELLETLFNDFDADAWIECTKMLEPYQYIKLLMRYRKYRTTQSNPTPMRYMRCQWPVAKIEGRD